MMTDRVKRARAAYKSIMLEPKEYGIDGWTPPPTDMKDKKWSRELRSMWAEYATVAIPYDAKRFSEMRNWCSQKANFYWHNSASNLWYFDRRGDAAMFKLTFGGHTS